MTRCVMSPGRTEGGAQRAGEKESNAEKKTPSRFREGVWGEAPGDDLLLHGLSHTTIGAGAFHFRVRDGIGWDHTAKVARELVRVARVSRARSLHWDLGRNRAFGAASKLSLRRPKFLGQ